MVKSESGKGLVICLVKFAEHSEELKIPSTNIYLWANAASDHLYDIEVPEGKEWDKIRGKVKELQCKGLEMGHRPGAKPSFKDALALKNLAQDIALMIDRKLGLKPQRGQW